MSRRHRCIREIEFAYLTHDDPGFPKRRRRTPAQQRGVLYEKRVHGVLEGRFRHEYLPSPWFYYKDVWARRAYWCQPDGLLLLPRQGKIIICEVKLRHTREAYYQLFELYLPVVKHAFGPAWGYSCCEIVRWYDPAEPCPEPPVMAKSPDIVNPGAFGVHIIGNR